MKIDDELLAEFDSNMELYVPKNPKYKPYWRRVGMQVSLKNMRYQSSWDWLMPVIEKIDGLDEEYTTQFGYSVMANLGIRSKYVYCTIQNWKGDEIAGTSGGVKTLIEAVYKTVIEFIKWYNDQKV
jgi:hypothetical protein